MTKSIMGLFAEWQALHRAMEHPINLSDEECEAACGRMSDLVDEMKVFGPGTAGEMAAFFYARTGGLQVICEKEDADYLLRAIEAEGRSSRSKAIPDPDIASLSISDMIDWNAVRHRVRAAGIILGASDFAETVAGQSNDQFNEDPAFTNFAATHGISIDWLVTGEGLPMLDVERVRRHPLAPAAEDETYRLIEAYRSAHAAYVAASTASDSIVIGREPTPEELAALDETGDKFCLAEVALCAYTPMTLAGGKARAELLEREAALGGFSGEEHFRALARSTAQMVKT